MAGREYKIDIVVDDHGAVEEIKKVTAAEQELVAANKQADQAIQATSKALIEGVKITRELPSVIKAKQQALRDAAKDWGTVTVSVQEAERVLSTVPTTVTGARSALNGLATDAGLTTQALGPLGTAWMVVGVAMGAWSLGRTIAEFTGLDDVIGRSVANLGGWGDAAQIAGARQDAINLAVARGADAHIRFADAVLYNDRWLKEWNETVRQGNLALAERQQRLEENAAANADFLRFVDEQAREQARQQARQQQAQTQLAQQLLGLATMRERAEWAVTKAITAQRDEMAKVVNEAVAANLQAQARLNEKQGLDVHGNPLALVNDPLAKAQRDLESLRASAPPGVNIAAREQEIYDRLQESLDSFTGTVVGGTQAQRDAADQAVNLSRAHAGAVAAVDAFSSASTRAAASAFGGFGGVQIGGPGGSNNDTGYQARYQSYIAIGYTPGEASYAAGGGVITGRIPRRAAGGPAWEGEPLVVGDGGRPEVFVPGQSGTITPMAGGMGAINVVVHAEGAVFENDRAIDRLADKVSQRLGQKWLGRT